MHRLNLQELRDKPRFAAPQLSVKIRYRHWWTCLLKPALSPQAFDYNRYGLGIWSEHPVPEGTRVLIDLKAADIHAKQVAAKVCNLRCIDGRYRLGLLFECYLHHGLSEAVLEADLLHIEKQISGKKRGV